MVRGLKKIKVEKNDCAVVDKGSYVEITFDDEIDVSGEKTKVFKLQKPNMEDNELATTDASVGMYGINNAMLSAYLSPKISSDEMKDVFTIKEHSALIEVMGHFL